MLYLNLFMIVTSDFHHHQVAVWVAKLISSEVEFRQNTIYIYIQISNSAGNVQYYQQELVIKELLLMDCENNA